MAKKRRTRRSRSFTIPIAMTLPLIWPAQKAYHIYTETNSIESAIRNYFAYYTGWTGNPARSWEPAYLKYGLAPLAAGVRRFFWLANLAAFLVYAAWMINHDDFLYVIYYYVPAMLLIAALQVWALLGKQSHGAGWILAGVVVTLCGAVVQQSGFALHTHFNYNDMFHLIQVVGLLLFFRGISRLTGQERAARGGNPA